MAGSMGAAAICLTLCSSAWISSAALAQKTVFVDARTGDDDNAGTSPRQSWRSLARLSRAALWAGTKVRLRRGSVWHEPLKIRASGAPGRPITIRPYGRGPRPLLAARGTENAIALLNVQYLHLSGLEVTNSVAAHGSVHRGVLIAADNIGTLRDIVVSDLYIHDVRGSNERKDNGGIVFRTTGARRPSRFVDLRIERNIIHRVDRSGIVGQSDQLSRNAWFPSLGVVIRDNHLEDLGGDAITPWATDGALVEHNVVRRAALRAPGYNAGIWQWSTDDTLIRLNEVFEIHGTRDGQGFDSDYNSTGTRLLYNYSHDNDGGFLLICTPVARDPKQNVGNRGTVARFNISRHDHARTFNLSGADDVLIERNAVYTPSGEDIPIVMTSAWDGWSTGGRFRDNLFVAGGVGRYGHGAARDDETGRYRLAPGFGGAREIALTGNRLVGRHIDGPADKPSSLAPRPLTDAARWTAPAFPGTDAIAFSRYMTEHRRWLVSLMTAQFGTPPQLTPPARKTEQPSPGRPDPEHATTRRDRPA